MLLSTKQFYILLVTVYGIGEKYTTRDISMLSGENMFHGIINTRAKAKLMGLAKSVTTRCFMNE
jgi:hypothetical protein